MSGKSSRPNNKTLLIKKYWLNHPLTILTLLFFVGSIFIFFHLKKLNLELIESITTQSSHQYVEVLEEFRSLYTSEVVATVSAMGIEVTHDYHLKKNAIPLPATLSLLLGERMGLKDGNLKARLYSAYPFPWRENTGGLTGQFEQDAWQALNKMPDKPVIKIESVDGILSVRYAIADIMRENCVECHNSHPDTPKKGWQLGDVRGVLEVIQPLEMGIKKVNDIFFQMVCMITILIISGMGGFYFTIKRLKSSNESLDQVNLELNTKIEQQKTTESKLYQATEKAVIAKEQANLSKEEAVAANKAKSVFLANISHEIRTPMNAILGYTQILQRESDLTDDQQLSLSIIGKSGEHLLGLINDVLDLSKIEAGASNVNLAPFDLIDLCNTLGDMFTLKAQQKGLVWKINIDLPVTHLTVLGDEGKIRQVLINLVANAIKFTDKGYVSFSLCCEKDDVFCFEITDSGMGIEKSQQSVIFDAFNQGNISQELGGTGLGLTISRKYLQLMKSELSVDSTVNQGSKFYFDIKLPVVESDLKTEQQQHVEHLEQGQFKRILVIDDVQVNRTILNRMLTDVGFDVIEAENGLDALNKLQDCDVDLIFTDLMMPIMGGREFLEQNKKLKPEIPIIAISASSLEYDPEYYIALGFASYISKPFHFNDIYALLKEILNVRFVYQALQEQSSTNINTELQDFCLPADKIEEIVEKCHSYQISDVEMLLAQLALANSGHDAYFEKLTAFVQSYDLDGLASYLQDKSNE